MDDGPRAEALRLWREGVQAQGASDLERAKAAYRRSLAVCPTAEAHTFLGWALSWEGDVDGAIAECRRAIAVDPSYGNPYNDIGAYLIEQGDLDGAVPWLERAKAAPRYEPRHFPFMNLARVHAARGRVTLALRELDQALALCPEDAELARRIAQLRALH